MHVLTDETYSAFHAGEREIQSKLGVRGELEKRAHKVVRDHLPDQHRHFYQALPFVVIAARDAARRPWSSLLAGVPGFVCAPSPTRLVLEATPQRGDALAEAIGPGSDLGLLGIDLARRRRNRANGRVSERTASRIDLAIEQTFGNCPRFIQPREWQLASFLEPRVPTRRASTLTVDQVAWIATSETFFVASGYRGSGESPAYGMDASHRGGPSGFVEVLDGRRLRFPDYAGNDHFNTFGNLIRDPRIGLTFVDFERGSLLQLTGVASIDWARPDPGRFPGSERLVEVRIDEVIEPGNPLPIRWRRIETGPV